MKSRHIGPGSGRADMAARGEQFRSKAIAGRIGIRKGPVISSPKKSTAYRFSRNCCRIILESLSSTGAGEQCDKRAPNVRHFCCLLFILLPFLASGPGVPVRPNGSLDLYAQSPAWEPCDCRVG